MSVDPAQERVERELEDHERRRREDRAADHAPVAEGRGAGTYELSWPLAFVTRRRGGGWIASVLGSVGDWDTGASEAEAIGSLMISVALRHHPDCPRPFHSGPCRGPLRSDGPESAREQHERHVEAVMAVLSGTELGDLFSEAKLRELAEGCLAAADTGI